MDWSFLKTDGRMRRTTFAVWCLVLTFVWPVLYTLPGIVFGIGAEEVGNAIGFVIMALGLYVSWCVAVQRAHDMGRSWTFVGLAWGLTSASLVLMGVFLISTMMSGPSLVFAIAAILAGIGGLTTGAILAFGTPTEDNRWGPDPR